MKKKIMNSTCRSWSRLVLCHFSALLALAGLAPAAQEPAAEPAYPSVLVQRRVDAGGSERLLTPVARYKDAAGRTVDLVGAVHLADASYYRNLNRAFSTRYDKVLYEMVDGEGLPEYQRLARKVKQGEATQEEKERFNRLTEEQKKGNSGAGAALGHYYLASSRLLELSLQSELVDYSLENMVFADMSMEEFSRAMAERGESWLSIALQSVSQDSSGGLGSGLVFSRRDLRRELVRALAASSTRNDAMQQGAIIISRNERCFAVLDAQLASAPAGTRIAIFYGAMHLRDMHHRLLSRGFTLQGVQWLTAIRA